MSKVEKKPDVDQAHEEHPVDRQEDEVTSEVAQATFEGAFAAQAGFYAKSDSHVSPGVLAQSAVADASGPRLDNPLGSQVFRWQVSERPAARTSGSSEKQRTEQQLKEIREEWMKGYSPAGRREAVRKAIRERAAG